MEPREGLQQNPVPASPAHPGHGSNATHSNAPVETTRSLVPRLPLRDVLGNGGYEISGLKYLKVLPAARASALGIYK